MRREEFSQLLKSIRKMAQCSMNEVCRRTGMAFTQLQSIEENYHNYSLVNVLRYLDAVKRVMLLKQGNEAIVVSKYEDIPNFLRKVREQKDCSRAELVQATGCSMSSITEMENKNTIMHIDSFLAITSALKIKIELKYR